MVRKIQKENSKKNLVNEIQVFFKNELLYVIRAWLRFCHRKVHLIDIVMKDCFLSLTNRIILWLGIYLQGELLRVGHIFEQTLENGRFVPPIVADSVE